MRPRPSNYVAWGSTDFLKKLYRKAKETGLVKRDSKWTLVFEDFQRAKFSKDELMDLANMIEMTPETCCILQNKFGSKFFISFGMMFCFMIF